MIVDQNGSSTRYDVIPHLRAAYQGLLEAREFLNTLSDMKELTQATQEELKNMEEIYHKARENLENSSE